MGPAAGPGRPPRYPAVPVGTTKRERQKANRQARLEELARQARKDKTKRRGLQITLAIVLGVGLLFLVAYLVSDDDDDTTATDVATTLVTDTTLDATATTVATTDTATGDTATGDTATGDTATGDTGTDTTDSVPTTDGSTTTEGPTTTVVEEFAYGEGDCPEADGSSEQQQSFDQAPQLCIDLDADYTAEVVTNRGDFTITLDPEHSPGNVNNFVTLSRFHYYDGTGCHRIIKEFVVQCGRPGTDETAPGYSIPDELPGEGEYVEGMVIMANTGEPDSGGGQWFIVTGADGASLPAQYSIIGQVTSGYETTVAALENLADPLASNGSPPLLPVDIESITITES